MKENKKRKINLMAFFLTVAVAVNVAMSVYICVDKVNDIKTVSEHESTVSDMQKNIDDLQKNVDDLQNFINSASPDLSSASDLQRQVESLIANNEYLEHERMNLIEQLDLMFTDDQSSADIKLAKELFEKAAEKIIEIRSSEFDKYPIAEPYKEVRINGFLYEKRDALYSDVVKEYSEIFTGDALETVLNDRFAEIDGYMYIVPWGTSGWGIENIKIQIFSESGDEITYKVKSDCTAANGEVFDINICTMTVKQVDGNYRISQFDYYQG